MSYLVITKARGQVDEPRAVHVEQLSRQDLLHRLQPDRDGSSYYAPLGGKIHFVRTIDEVIDPDQIPVRVMIVKGEVIVPAERDLHTMYEVP